MSLHDNLLEDSLNVKISSLGHRSAIFDNDSGEARCLVVIYTAVTVEFLHFLMI